MNPKKGSAYLFACKAGQKFASTFSTLSGLTTYATPDYFYLTDIHFGYCSKCSEFEVTTYNFSKKQYMKKFCLGKENNICLESSYLIKSRIEILEKKALTGNPYAALILAKIFISSTGGIPRSFQKVAKWYQLAASATLAEPKYYLSLMYETGQGVTKSTETAKTFLLEAANLGRLEAQVKLAKMYENKEIIIDGSDEIG